MSSAPRISSRIWAELWLPLLAWCVLVQVFSSDAFSWGETSKLLTPVLTFFLPDASMRTLDSVHFLIRKLSHVVEYLILGWLVVRALEPSGSGSPPIWQTLCFVVLFAASDEIRQSLTLTRGPSVVDVGIDSVGGALGLGIGVCRRGNLREAGEAET